MGRSLKPGDAGYRAPDDNFASSQSIDDLINSGYSLSDTQYASLNPEQRTRYGQAYSNLSKDGNGRSIIDMMAEGRPEYDQQRLRETGIDQGMNAMRYDPRFPGQNIKQGVDPNYIDEMGGWEKLALGAMLAGGGAGLAGLLGPGTMAGTVGAGFGAGAGAGAALGAPLSTIPGLAGVPNIGTAAGAFPLTTAAPSAIEAGIFPLTTGGGVGGMGAAGSAFTLDNAKKIYDAGNKTRNVVNALNPEQPNQTQVNPNQLALMAAIAMASQQNTGGNKMSTWSPNGSTLNLPGATTTGGGSGNLLTGQAPSATTTSRSLMTPEQDSTLSQLLAKLNAGNNITPYTGVLNAPKNDVQTGALQGMSGVMSNLDQNTKAYGGQLNAGNNNLQNISLTALEQMALGNASNNSANQSSVKALTDFTNAGPADINAYFNSSVQDPMLRDFQSKILPQLTQRFSGQAGFGSDRQKQEQLVTNDMMNTLANSRTNMAFNAQNQANSNKMQAAMALPGVTSAGVNDMLNMQSGGMKQNNVDQAALDNQYKDFIRQLSGNTQNANILGSLQSGGNIGQATDQQPLTSQYQEFLRGQTGNQQNIANTINALGIRPFENISTVQGQQNGLLQGLLGGLAAPGGLQGGSDLLNTLMKSLGGGSSGGGLDMSSLAQFAPELFNYSDMLGNGVSNAVPDIYSTLGGGNTMSQIPDLFSSLFN